MDKPIFTSAELTELPQVVRGVVLFVVIVIFISLIV